MLLRRGTSIPRVASLVPMLLVSLSALLLVLLRRLDLAFFALILVVFSMMMRPLFQTVVFELLVPLRWGIQLLLRRTLRVIFDFR